MLQILRMLEKRPLSAAYLAKAMPLADKAIRAEQEGCDYIIAGSIFPTTSHPKNTGGAGTRQTAVRHDVPQYYSP